MANINEIKQLLSDAFPESQINVTDDSAKHAGHAGARPGGGTHFSVQVVSAAFAGKRQVARHRLIYEILQPLFADGLHALALETLTPEEDVSKK